MKINRLTWKIYQDDYNLNLEHNHLLKFDVEKCFATKEDKFKQVISENEYQKSLRYINPKDFKRYIVSKYFIRIILSNIIGKAPKEIQFEYRNNKKPSISEVEFNVSHSGNFVIIALSTQPVGVDIEFINQSFDFQPLLFNCFHPQEIVFLNNNNNSVEKFYGIWTRKEALLKATGEGLIDKLDQIKCLDIEISRHNTKYNLNTFFAEEDYIVSIATISLKEFIFWEIN